jgi:hemolysin III
MWMRRLDHLGILLLIAGTYTPFALLAFEGRLAIAILIAVWIGVAVGVVLNLAWVGAPSWVRVPAFVALGWVGLAGLPQLLDLGIAPALLVFAGGVLYTVGAVVYGLKRPDPAPAVFGYHEIFHLLVIAAAATHFVAIAAFVLPSA